MKAKPAHMLLGLVAALASVEVVASAFAYRDPVDDADWAAVRETARTGMVRSAEGWLEPRLRANVGRAAQWESAAPVDLWGVDTLFVVSTGPAWSDLLQADLEGRGAPELVNTHEAGSLSVHEYRFDDGQRVSWSLVDDPKLRVRAGSGRCKGRGGDWRCKPGRVQRAVAEIDYRPRRCLVLDGPDGEAITLSAKVELGDGDTLRGHIGFGDFNGRLRSDAPWAVTLSLDGAVVSRWTVMDDEGWRVLSVPVGGDRGPHDLEVRLVPAVQGTWQRDGYKTRPSRPACVELRAIQTEAR